MNRTFLLQLETFVKVVEMTTQSGETPLSGQWLIKSYKEKHRIRRVRR
jgi:hypothetical protein